MTKLTPGSAAPLSMDREYAERRREIESKFKRTSRVHGQRVRGVSPSGNFQLTIDQYSTGPGTWAYSRGRVREVGRIRTIADIKRNYGHFWHSWTVDGCYWGAPYDVAFFDFSAPDQLPYKELARVKGLAECIGWTDSDTFRLTQEVEVRKADGRPYVDLSDEEQEALDNDSGLVGYEIRPVAISKTALQRSA